MAEPNINEQLARIRERNARLANVPFNPCSHGDNCIPCDLVASAEDVRWLLEFTTGLRQRWGAQAEHSTSAFPARSQEQAQQMAAMNSRIREPGCLPTPYHVVTRFEGDWQRVDTDTEQQPEDGDHG